MCLALYLAGSQELPVIPWDESKPGFHVVRLPKSVEAVREQFSSKYVYYVGSAQGCSCAFNYEHEYDSIVELRDYLRNALICVDQVEIFACQAGNEKIDRQHSGTVSPEEIVLADFLFRDGQYLVVKRGKTYEQATEAEKCIQRATQPIAAVSLCCAPSCSVRHADLTVQSVGS